MDEIEALMEIGYRRIENPKIKTLDAEYNKIRYNNRLWRNLVSEAKFDIPPCLHEYIDWTPPKPLPSRFYDFKIKIPDFSPIGVVYQLNLGSSWTFYHFELMEAYRYLSSSNYYDLPVYLVYASKKTIRREVVLEEVSGSLSENVKTVKTFETKKIPFGKRQVLRESDFFCKNPYSDIPICF